MPAVEKAPLVVAFSGSRTFTDARLVEATLRRLSSKHFPLRVRVGDARGLDRLVILESARWGIWPEVETCHWPPSGASRQEKWAAAHERNWRVLAYPPGKPAYVRPPAPHAGHILRTEAMNIDLVYVDLLIAFYAPGRQSPGTTDCISQALELGIPQHVFHEGEWLTHRP